MHELNVILVFSPQKDRILLCKRMKNPYIGKLNLVGGKVEAGENPEDAAYRELYEETGITREDIRLARVMDTAYFPEGIVLQAFAGRLRHEVTLVEETNPLLWRPVDDNFFDLERYAGDGSIGHILEVVRQYEGMLLD